MVGGQSGGSSPPPTTVPPGSGTQTRARRSRGYTGHTDWILSADWSHHDQRIATASADGTIRIWDAETGSQLTVAGVQADRAEAVAWSPDATRLASASRDGTARLWDATLSLAAIAGIARSRLLRSLTTDERRNLMLPTEPSTAAPPFATRPSCNHSAEAR